MLQEQSLGKGEKIMSIAKMLNRTMFDIEKIGNFKYVHFWGYLYASEYDNMYCHLEYVGFFVPLSEVLNEGFSAYEENHQEFYNQTIADCDEQQVVRFCEKNSRKLMKRILIWIYLTAHIF